MYRVYREHDARYYKEYESAKDYLIARFGEFCGSCGKEGGRLHLHHIDGDHDNWSHDNLELLCPRCHGSEHRKKACTYCGNLVPVNHHNGRAYWTNRNGSPVCYDCKEDPHLWVDITMNYPPEIGDRY